MTYTPSPLRVLILEDNPEDAKLFVRELQRANFDPDRQVVATEQEYLAHLDPGLDVILSDHSMPAFNSLKALHLLHERGLDIPFIIVSGTIGEEAVVAALKAGASDFLNKDHIGGGALGRSIRHAIERKRTDLHLRELAAIVEQSQDSIFLKDLRGVIQSWNQGAEQIYGYTAGEVIGKSVSMLMPLERQQETGKILEQIGKGEKIGPFETERIRKDGAQINMSITVSPIFNEQGKVVAASTVARDITGRVRAEAEVRRMQDLFRALTENAPDGVALIDKDGHMKLVSPAGRRMFGYGLDENPDMNPAELMHPDDLPVVLTALSHLIENPLEIPTLQYRFRHKNGSWLWIESTFTNLLSLKSVEAIVINFRDITERRQAERALLQSEQRYRVLFEDTPLAIWEEDFSRIKAHLEQLKRNGVSDFRTYFTAHPESVSEYIAMMQILDINKAALQMYEADNREALVMGTTHLLSKGEWKNFCEDLICIAEGRTGNSWEGSDETLKGKPIQISLKWSVVPGHEDDFSKVIVTTVDITERKQAEERIQTQLKWLASLRAIDQAISGTQGLHSVLELALKRGLAELQVDAGVILLYNPEEGILRYELATGMRTNALKFSRLKLGEGYAGKAALSRRTMFISDLHNRTTDFLRSPSFLLEGFACYFGVPLIAKNEIKGVLEIFHRAPLAPEQEWLDFMGTVAGQIAIAIDNANLWERTRQHARELEARVVERTAELNRANLELERANRTKDEFLANMSHELRTPLNSILGLSESLLEQRRDPLSEHQQNSLRIIESSGHHLLELINDILDLSKVEAGKLDVHPQATDVNAICRSSLTFVSQQALQKSITLTYEGDDAVSEVQADPRRLKQILVNLLTNAVKFTSQGGKITLEVHADADNDLVQFSVMDNGIGIAPQDLQRLFQPFVQVDSSLNRQQQGTGLGLTLVQKLTDLHGGSVQVESEVGKGSRFTVNLPWSRQVLDGQKLTESDTTPSAEEPSANRLEEPLEHGTILLVEDSLPNILTIGEYLESHGHDVRVAHDGLEAVQMAEETNPDIILMDIQMPVMDGLEASRRLRANAHFDSTPIIALTALAMPGDRERCLEAGANEYMSKPVSLKKLLHTINLLLDARNNGDDRRQVKRDNLGL